MGSIFTVLQDPKNILYIVSIFATIGLVYFLYKKYKLTKYQLMIFILLVLFWSSVNIIRAYRKAYAGGALEIGGLGMDAIMAANIAAAYGLISMFVRLPIFALSDFFKSRKFFIGLALTMIIGTSVWVVMNPNYDSMMASSLTLGLAASMLALFNVMFAETFSKEQAIISVSILSIAPLLAEFIVAPLQYYATQSAVKNYPWMWSVSALLGVIALVMLMFVKDNKSNHRNFSVPKFMEVIKDYRFLVLCLLGVTVSFIKFGSSGSNIVKYAQSEVIGMSPLGVAYIDVFFTLFQLAAGVLMGIYLKKKIGVRNTLLLGIGSSMAFVFIVTITTNPNVIFISNALNGFGYGIAYNCLLGLAMQPFRKEYREISMGIYQTFFAVGIFYGDKIYALLKQAVPNGLFNLNDTQSVFFLLGVVSLITMGLIMMVFKKGTKFLEG